MRLPGDPLLRFGIVAMAFAVLCAGLVAAYALLSGGPEAAKAGPDVKAASAEPLVRSDPGVEPWKEEDVPPPRLEEPNEDPPPEPDPPEPEQSGPKPEQLEPEPLEPEPPESEIGPPESEPRESSEEPAGESQPTEEDREPSLPVAEEAWPTPTPEQVEMTREPRRYDLPRGAALGLTVPSVDLYGVPVLRSNSQQALDNGVVHMRGSSMPWSDTPERNVYLAGHRLGWPGTGSHLVFYRLNELSRGDEVVLRGRDGGTYHYEVTASFVVNPDDVWVTGRIPGRDMLTLQTCTPIPGFEQRLIVRAERV